MIQQVIEVIDRQPLAPSRLQGSGFLVGTVESLWKSSKEIGHAQLRLSPAVMRCRIYDRRLAVGSAECVSRPQISVNERRGLGWHQLSKSCGKSRYFAKVFPVDQTLL